MTFSSMSSILESSGSKGLRRVTKNARASLTDKNEISFWASHSRDLLLSWVRREASTQRRNATVAPRKSSRHFLRSWVMFSMAFFLSAVDFVIKAVIKAEIMPINAAVISEFILSIIIIYFLNFRGRASRGLGVGRACHCVAGPQLGAVAAGGLGPIRSTPNDVGSLGILDETNRVSVASLIIAVRAHRRTRREETVVGSSRRAHRSRPEVREAA